MIKPNPPASLADTREAVERMDARGNTLVPVDETHAEGIVRDLVESGVESLTVALINSYVNGAHERRIGEIVERLYPGFPVTLSSEVLPEFREYERALTESHELVRAAEGARATSTTSRASWPPRARARRSTSSARMPA